MEPRLRGLELPRRRHLQLPRPVDGQRRQHRDRDVRDHDRHRYPRRALRAGEHAQRRPRTTTILGSPAPPRPARPSTSTRRPTAPAAPSPPAPPQPSAAPGLNPADIADNSTTSYTATRDRRRRQPVRLLVGDRVRRGLRRAERAVLARDHPRLPGEQQRPARHRHRRGRLDRQRLRDQRLHRRLRRLRHRRSLRRRRAQPARRRRQLLDLVHGARNRRGGQPVGLLERDQLRRGLDQPVVDGHLPDVGRRLPQRLLEHHPRAPRRTPAAPGSCGSRSRSSASPTTSTGTAPPSPTAPRTGAPRRAPLRGR